MCIVNGSCRRIHNVNLHIILKDSDSVTVIPNFGNQRTDYRRWSYIPGQFNGF